MISTRQVAMAALITLWASVAQAALVLHEVAFIGTPTHFNGFEGAGSYQLFNTPYGEDGIQVTFDAHLGGTPYLGQVYVGNGSGITGSHGWFADPGTPGFTVIRLQNGQPLGAIQFTMASTWTEGQPTLLYQLRNQGSLVAEGSAGAVALYNGGVRTLGFSGIVFDEVRLQQPNQPAVFGAVNVRDGAVLDNIAVGRPVPEPAIWALLLVGFGSVGAALRRRGSSSVLRPRGGCGMAA